MDNCLSVSVVQLSLDRNFPAEDAIVFNAIIFYKVPPIHLIIYILMCFSFLHCHVKSISFQFTSDLSASRLLQLGRTVIKCGLSK